MYFQRPRRSITAGELTPSARYSTATSAAAGASPASAGARLRPSSEPSPSSPHSSSSVGARSSSETGSATRPGAIRPGAETISGTRADGSKKAILYQSPRSPSISPWSAVKSTIVSSRRPDSASAPSTSPMRSSA